MFWEPGDDHNEPSSSSRSRRLFVSNCLFLIFCIHFIALSIISRSLSLCIFTKISWSTINFKTENGSRLITEYYAFTIRVDQVNFLREKFGVSAYSRISTVYLSEALATCPETKSLPRTQSLYKISLMRAALLIAEIQRNRLCCDSISASNSPWFVTTEAIWAKYIPLSWPHPTTIHNTIAFARNWLGVFFIFVHQYDGVAMVVKIFVMWVKTIYSVIK